VIRKFLRAWFAAESAVTAILGSSPLRLFPGTAPQGAAFPRAIYQQQGGEDITQVLTQGGDVWTAEYQITLTDKGHSGYENLRTLKAAIIGTPANPKLHHYSGTLGGVEIVKAKLENEIDSTTPPEESSDNTIHEVFLDFRFWYVRSE